MPTGIDTNKNGMLCVAYSRKTCKFHVEWQSNTGTLITNDRRKIKEIIKEFDPPTLDYYLETAAAEAAFEENRRKNYFSVEYRTTFLIEGGYVEDWNTEILEGYSYA